LNSDQAYLNRWSAVLFERRHEKLLPRRNFLKRLAKFTSISVGLIVISLIIGMVGYDAFEGLPWVNAFLNAAMLMGGMGQIFAGIYALYCGMVLLTAVGVFAAPIVHRFLHRFYLEKKTEDQ
jgi:CBS domain containing-hemolysin-like protein